MLTYPGKFGSKLMGKTSLSQRYCNSDKLRSSNSCFFVIFVDQIIAVVIPHFWYSYAYSFSPGCWGFDCAQYRQLYGRGWSLAKWVRAWWWFQSSVHAWQTPWGCMHFWSMAPWQTPSMKFSLVLALLYFYRHVASNIWLSYFLLFFGLSCWFKLVLSIISCILHSFFSSSFKWLLCFILLVCKYFWIGYFPYSWTHLSILGDL